VDNDPSVAAALARLDEALAAKPRADGHSFSLAAHELSMLRDTMAARQREAGASAESRRRLEHVNAVISVVLGGHFPLGDIPWGELEKARGWLARLGHQDAAKE
jgi:hypothetical protein